MFRRSFLKIIGLILPTSLFVPGLGFFDRWRRREVVKTIGIGGDYLTMQDWEKDLDNRDIYLKNDIAIGKSMFSHDGEHVWFSICSKTE